LGLLDPLLLADGSLAAVSDDFFWELFLDPVELLELSALAVEESVDWFFLDFEDFLGVSEVALDSSEPWVSALALLLGFFLVVPESALWSLLDCGLAKAGEADSVNHRHTAAAKTTTLIRGLVMNASLRFRGKPRDLANCGG
jgi:hypothetical protein